MWERRHHPQMPQGRGAGASHRVGEDAAGVARHRMVPDYSLDISLFHELGPGAGNLMDQQVHAGAVFDDILIVAHVIATLPTRPWGMSAFRPVVRAKRTSVGPWRSVALPLRPGGVVGPAGTWSK